MAQPTPPPKERVLFSDVFVPLAGLHERPTFTQAFGARMLQRDHADQFRSFFQLLVLSGLVPLITLFAG